MAIPKKGSRTIEVDGATYRWKVTGNDMVIDVIIEQDNLKGQKLRATFDYHNETPEGKIKKQERLITPGVIKELIVFALKNGWVPGQNGKPDYGLDGEKVVPINYEQRT